MRKLLTLLISLNLSACSLLGPTVKIGKNNSGSYKAFYQGEIDLDCHLACGFEYGQNRAELKQLFEQGSWQNLASRIIEIGLGSDQSYYYLAKAAEGLKYPKAAQTYYLASIREKNHCDSILNNCDGFEFPALAQAGLAVIQNPIISTASNDKELEIAEEDTLPPKITRLDLLKKDTKPIPKLKPEEFVVISHWSLAIMITNTWIN